MRSLNSALIRAMRRRFESAWAATADDLRARGADWYPAARRALQALQGGRQLCQLAGAAAALSPGCEWSVCLTGVARLLAWLDRGKQGPRPVVATYSRANVAKAVRILQSPGALLELSGPKVVAFYQTLTGTSQPVIDGHLLSTALHWQGEHFRRVHYRHKFQGRLYAYKSLRSHAAQALQQASGRLKVPLEELQATLWLAAKMEKP